MARRIFYLIFLIVFIISGCGSIKTLNSESKEYNSNEEEFAQCEKCKVIPKDGSYYNRMHGYYYDTIDNKCKEIYYSGGGINAPFKTFAECEKCCLSQ